MNKISLLSALILLTGSVYSQNISISDQAGQTADSSAVLDVSSTAKGMLIPRMTAAERAAISSPANGLMVFQTDGEEGFYYYSGSSKESGWIPITSQMNSPWKSDSTKHALYTVDLNDSVGIGTLIPNVRLSANGMIEAMEGGFMFPDGTVQASASRFDDEGGGADGRWVIGLWCSEINGSWNYGNCNDCSRVIKLDWEGYYYVGGGTATYFVFTRFDIYKDIDEATVPYIQKYIQGQTLQHMILSFYWVSPADDYEEYYRMELTGFNISWFRQNMFYTAKNTWAHLDVISFRPDSPLHSTIKWEYLPQGIQFEVEAGPEPTE
ncbi:MAG: type VI secretion system tube protein Hcp [Bacteroidales bacterium]|nr:type VI secretion system tube protein Hcp [Bacteroidales bacterium]